MTLKTVGKEYTNILLLPAGMATNRSRKGRSNIVAAEKLTLRRK